ncbi:hypothetical protein FOTG_17732 [Fusarium oxysporum f. sp. vasinfectum 25433]|uniref:Uncharacterized protein n=1 Tax=Fusarium oxysporum f. sp. vasinfectum 25433 TaxID=1089449 RepID=X0LZG9_FUSOX|nr:hypothetical protein FOTG_17732 [Fusarium oxysporum f. sp. vasinfectum 25433]
MVDPEHVMDEMLKLYKTPATLCARSSQVQGDKLAGWWM